MKTFYRIAIATLFAAGLAAQVKAQQAAPSTTQAQPSASTAAQTGVRIAVISPTSFYDPQRGITRLVAVMKGVEQEFQPRKNELTALEQRGKQITDELNKGTVTDPKLYQSKQDQLNQIKVDLKRKSEDAEVAFRKRMQEAISPTLQDVEKALDAYVKAHGITLLLDADRLEGGLIYVGVGTDITRDFIADYNRRNPGAATTTPTPARR